MRHAVIVVGAEHSAGKGSWPDLEPVGGLAHIAAEPVQLGGEGARRSVS